MKKKFMLILIAGMLLGTVTGCGDMIAQKAEEAWQEAQDKIMESVKEEINEQVQKILEENQIEIPEDFDIENFNVGELEDATGLDFSSLENMDKLDLGELDLSQLEDLLEQLMSVDFESVESNLAE